MDTVSEYAESAALIETVKKVNGRWALVSRKTEKVLAYYNGEGEPSDDWVRDQERRIQYFSEFSVDEAKAFAPKALVPHVFCDIDGVIANFSAGMEHYFGIQPAQLDAFFRIRDVWKTIAEKHPHLYVKLSTLPDARQLMTGLAQLRDHKLIQLSMLTAIPEAWYTDPVMRRVSTADKITWVTRHFPQIPAANVLVVRRKDKASYAKAQIAAGRPYPILIDDFHMNIREWEAAGGIGIEHTRAGASLRALLVAINVI